MMNEQIKKDNKKALPKFFLILLISMICGGIVGGVSVSVGMSSLRDTALNIIHIIMRTILPWGIPVSIVLLLGPAAWLIHKEKQELKNWDGEDEEAAEHIESMGNRTLLLSNICMLVDMFFFSAVLVYQYHGLLWETVLFLIALLACTVLQQKVVDIVRTMNPEKRGSIYDRHFQKKWMDSCDEMEQRHIGEAAMKAYRAGSMTCVILWLVLFVIHLIFDTGLLPIAIVLLIWAVMLISYHMEAVRLGKSKK